MSHYSVNEAAAALLEKEVLPNTDKLNISLSTLPCGATVIDMGVHVKGGFRAGKYFAEVGMGGLGTLRYCLMKNGSYQVPGLQVVTDNPAICEMSSYVAATLVPWRGKSQVISGPVRSILATDKFAQSVSYRDPAPCKAVAGVQTTELPDDELAMSIGKTCGIAPERLYIMATRTGCMTGAVQVCARNVEQSMPSLHDQGYDMECILEGNATTPLVTVADDEDIAYGRVNDCLIYGQETNLTVSCEDENIERLMGRITFSKNTDVYGIPFQELFADCDQNWANVPREWDAPCKVNFCNIRSGHTYSDGKINEDVLEKDFLGEGGRVR